ncbi:MAG: hypothetical protein AB7R89_28220 [Dehalococcoidia bacterium]
MRWIPATIAIIALSLVACGSDSDQADTLSAPTPAAATSQSVSTTEAAASVATTAPTATATPPPRGTPSEADVRAALITLQDLPTGWTIDPDPDTDEDDGEGTICDIPSARQSRLVSVEANFQKGTIGPFISHAISVYQDGAAKQLMDDAVKILETCREWETTNDDGSPLVMKLTPLSFAKVGEQTFAFRATMTSGGFPFQADIVYLRDGDVMHVVTYMTVGVTAPDTELTETLAKTAHDRSVKADLAGE